MDTLSLESLLITEDEWVATEGLGSMVKKAGSVIWGAIKTLCKKLITKIKELIKKINKKRHAIKAQNNVRSKNDASVQIIDYRPIITDAERDFRIGSKMIMEFGEKLRSAQKSSTIPDDALVRSSQQMVQTIDNLVEKYPQASKVLHSPKYQTINIRISEINKLDSFLASMGPDAFKVTDDLIAIFNICEKWEAVEVSSNAWEAVNNFGKATEHLIPLAGKISAYITIQQIEFEKIKLSKEYEQKEW